MLLLQCCIYCNYYTVCVCG